MSGRHYLELKLDPLPKKVSRLQLETFIHAVRLKISTDERYQKLFPDDSDLSWKPPTVANRGFTDTANGLTAAKKAEVLEQMLKTIHVLCQHVNRLYILNESQSLDDIWNKLRTYYGYRKTGARPLDLPGLKLKAGEQSYEDLWEETLALGEDCLQDPSTPIRHLGVKSTTYERFQPSNLNNLVVWWLNAIDARLPLLVKERFAKELTNNDLYSVREEISEAIPSLLAHLEQNISAHISRMRTQQSSFRPMSQTSTATATANKKVCSICYTAKLPFDHFQSRCPHCLPHDRARLQPKVRLTQDLDPATELSDIESLNLSGAGRVEVERSPTLDVMHASNPVSILIDCGAESNVISVRAVEALGIPYVPTSQGARQADGRTHLNVVGECVTEFTLGPHHRFYYDGLVVDSLGTSIVGGSTFMRRNAIVPDLSTRTVYIGQCCMQRYHTKVESMPTEVVTGRICNIYRVPRRVSLMPGETLEVPAPSTFSTNGIVAVEPRQTKTFSTYGNWLQPGLHEVTESGTVCISNSLSTPVRIQANEQLCNVRQTTEVSPPLSIPDHPPYPQSRSPTTALDLPASTQVQVDPDRQLDPNIREKFRAVCATYEEAFNPKLGRYNGASGKHEMRINMGPTKPPPRKGRCPVYAHSDRQLLQTKFDELLDKGVFAKPEELGIQIETVSPSFLVRKGDNGNADGEDLGLLDRSRLVTAFGEVAQFAKVPPCLMSNIDDVLDRIGQWSYIIQSDLSQAYYQIPVARDSLKWLGVTTPFRGTYVYQRAAMGMPGSEACLEEVMCSVFGDLMKQGKVVKVADDIFCGAESPAELLSIWEEILQTVQANGLHLSAKKTLICPVSTSVLGWMWNRGTITASQHKLSALETCDPPKTVRALRGFVASYKFLSRVLPETRPLLDPLEAAYSQKKKSTDPIEWTETLSDTFRSAQRHLSKAKAIVTPRPDDELHIVTDASLNQRGLAATLFAIRKGVPKLAGFFNAKMKAHQQRWLPCEVEALCISAAVNFFAPKISRSKHRCTIFTDSKPCVQAYKKMCRGNFSNSARVMTFLSSLTSYGVDIQHISGSKNLVADFSSRNPIECQLPDKCHVCKFVNQSEEAMIGAVSIDDISDISIDMFTSRTAWKEIQMSDPDLRRVYALLSSGRPVSKNTKKARDVKRYLNEVQISTKDQLLIRRPIKEQLTATRDRIVVPRSIMHGLVTSLHLKLNHPSKKQLTENVTRNFFALNMSETIDAVQEFCDVCASMKAVPKTFIEQSTSRPADTLGTEFSADVVRRHKQCILLLRENTTSYTTTTFVENETAESIREGLIYLSAGLRNQCGPKVTVRVDPAPAFRKLATDTRLKELGISIEIGDEKNTNKNPIAERACRELHSEIVKYTAERGPLTREILALVTSNMNNLIRHNQLSSREMWTQRDQVSGLQIPLRDKTLIEKKLHDRIKNHLPSAKYKSRGKDHPSYPEINLGSLVYVLSERDKTQRRDKYIVTRIEHPHCWVQKFVGEQLRARSYRVHIGNCHPLKLSSCVFEAINAYDGQPSSDDDSIISDDDEGHRIPNPAVNRDDDNLDPVGGGFDVDDNNEHDDVAPVLFDNRNQEIAGDNDNVNFPIVDVGRGLRNRANLLLPADLREDYELDYRSSSEDESDQDNG